MTAPRSDELLRDLCDGAADAARVRGHELGEWKAPAGEEAFARSAACRRCGRVAYVRAEGALAGAAGPALAERCGEPAVADVTRR
jgi:hypothetical protein